MKHLIFLMALSLTVSCMAQKQTTGLNQIVTKQSIGLGNVDNTSDLTKPVSTVQKTYIDSKIGLNGLKGDKGDKGDAGNDVPVSLLNTKFDKAGGGIDGNVGIGIAVPTDKLHLRWGNLLLEGDGVSFKVKNGVGNTYPLASLGNNNVFSMANNLLKLDPQWGSTALTINGGLVASNVPIYLNNSANNFIVKTSNGTCRKLVIADDGSITTPLVACP